MALTRACASHALAVAAHHSERSDVAERAIAAGAVRALFADKAWACEDMRACCVHASLHFVTLARDATRVAWGAVDGGRAKLEAMVARGGDDGEAATQCLRLLAPEVSEAAASEV